jgi:hypothetical protein
MDIMYRTIALLGMLALTTPLNAADDPPVHVTRGGAWAKQPTLPESMAKRVETAAAEYEQNAPVPRMAFFDIAYPSSDAELKAMGGYGVILVTILTQDAHELPPARVYGSVDGSDTAFQLVTSSIASTSQSALVTKVLGKNRWDGLFLFPVQLARDGAQLAIDFATHRKGFVLGRFSSADQQRLPYSRLALDLTAIEAPPSEVVMELVSREFPGFVSGQ